MRAQAQLHHDADMVEQIAPSPAKAHLDACKEHFGIVITEAAEASSVFRALERKRPAAPGVELSTLRSAQRRNRTPARRRGGYRPQQVTARSHYGGLPALNPMALGKESSRGRVIQ